MQAAGLEKGGIYRHFDSQQELAAEAFEHARKVAIDTRFEGTDNVPNAVDRLKEFLRNFRERRAGLVAGGCPLLDTAIDSDDGNPRLRGKARQALDSWLDRLQSIVEDGPRKAEIRADMRPAQLATLIIGTLEGSLMLRRLQRKEEPLNLACHHLEEYIETKMRARKRKNGAGRS